MRAPTTPAYVEHLTRLAEADASGFADLRRTLINDLIFCHDDGGGRLRALQGEIDCHLVSTLAPHESLELLMAILAARIGELKRLSECLMQLNAMKPMEPKR